MEVGSLVSWKENIDNKFVVNFLEFVAIQFKKMLEIDNFIVINNFNTFFDFHINFFNEYIF